MCIRDRGLGGHGYGIERGDAFGVVHTDRAVDAGDFADHRRDLNSGQRFFRQGKGGIIPPLVGEFKDVYYFSRAPHYVEKLDFYVRHLQAGYGDFRALADKFAIRRFASGIVI